MDLDFTISVLDFTISVIILVPYVCQFTFMTCPADLSKNAMSMNRGVSKIQLRMKTHVLPLFSKCSLYQKPTQTNTNKKTKLGL